MKALLVAEYRDGQLLGSVNELIDFAGKIGAESALFLVGSKEKLPGFAGDLYLAEASEYGEFNPEVHKQLLLDVVTKVQPELVVFSHSSYGWDLAPRVAFGLKAAQVSEVVDVVNGVPVVPVCNGKLRREVHSKTGITVMTLQAGAFGLPEDPSDTPTVIEISTDSSGAVSFEGYEAAEAGGVDLSKSEIIVSGGRGIGKPENVSLIADLAAALGGEYGASRPVVDAEWVEHNRQVGTTGQSVSPKLYIACGISGAIQHLAGMKKSEFIVAINTDRDAPIAEAADVLIVADLKQFIPVLTEKLKG
jgi:electron transfer flavoprotein alpha subunit